MPAFGAIGLGSHLLIAVAGGVPSIDLKATCHLAAGVQAVPTQREIDICMSEEQSAGDTLTKQWAQFNAADKLYCVPMATKGYLPSYTELLTCLEMSAHVKTIRSRPATP